MNNVDTTKNIWEYFFLSRVPYLLSKTTEELKTFGVRISGDKRDDDNIKNEWLTVYLSIAQMVDYHKEGVTIGIINQSELPKIYEFISLHLAVWKRTLETEINIGGAPIDDLIAMDNFATSVYSHAVHQFSQAEAESLMAKFLSERTVINRYNFFQGKNLSKYLNSDEPTVSHNGDVKVKERESMGEFFRDKLIGFGRYS